LGKQKQKEMITFLKYIEESKKLPYYILYHSSDSENISIYDPQNAQKLKENDGVLYFNPLGEGMYFSTNKEFSRQFGRHLFEYHLPKTSKINYITKSNWESRYFHVVKKTLKYFKIDYWNDVDIYSKVELRKIGNNAPINSMNDFSTYMEIKYNKLNPNDIKFIIEKIMTEKNKKYDAVWYKNTDYYLKADEIVISKEKFDQNLLHKIL
jgi:hypothetical protein